jgi:hypothetical protein
LAGPRSASRSRPRYRRGTRLAAPFLCAANRRKDRGSAVAPRSRAAEQIHVDALSPDAGHRDAAHGARSGAVGGVWVITARSGGSGSAEIASVALVGAALEPGA